MQRKAQTEHSSKLATDRVNGTNQTGFGLLELKSGYRFIRRGVYGTAAIHDYLNEVKPEKYGLEREWIVKAVAGDETVFNAIYDAARKAIGSSQNPKMPQSVVNFFLALGAEIAGRYERGPSAAYRAFMDAGLKIETSEIEQAVRKAAKIAVVIDKRAKKPNLSGTSIASEISVHKSKVLEYLSDPDVKATIRDLSEGIGTLPKPHVDADSNE
jgi:hypothetical protein